MLFCTKCARLLDDGAEKCPHCGNELRSNADLLNESHFDLPDGAAFAGSPAPVYEAPAFTPVFPSAPETEEPMPVPHAPVTEEPMPVFPGAPVLEKPIPPVYEVNRVPEPSMAAVGAAPALSELLGGTPTPAPGASAAAEPLDDEVSRLNRLLAEKKSAPNPVPASASVPTPMPSYAAPGSKGMMGAAAAPGTDFRAYGGTPARAAAPPPVMPSAPGYAPSYAAAPEDSVGTGAQIGFILLAMLAPLFGLIAGASMRSNAAPARRAFGKTMVIVSVIQFVMTGGFVLGMLLMSM